MDDRQLLMLMTAIVYSKIERDVAQAQSLAISIMARVDDEIRKGTRVKVVPK